MIPHRALSTLCSLVLLALPAGLARQADGQASGNAASQSTSVDDDFRLGWPRQFDNGGYHFELFQPQITAWDNLTVQSRLAIAVTPTGAAAPIYGILGLSAGTLVDKQDGVVYLQQITIQSLDLPGDAAQVAAIRQALTPSLPQVAGAMSIAELQGALRVNQALSQGQGAGQPVRNTPPTFFYSESPGLLVLLDGAPAMRNFSAPFLRAVNTTALLMMNQSTGLWYLRAFGGWMTAKAATGPWSPLGADAAGSGPGSLSASLDAALTAAKQLGTLDLFDPQPNTPPPAGPVPVFVSEGPAELIETQGPPAPAPIPGTGLLYVTNTQSQILVDPSTSTYYVLVSGRWFSTPSLSAGPWTFVPGSKLPPDFAKIPPDAPSGAALVSVPGTTQAQDAAIGNSIPQTAVVSRSTPNLQVTYQGPPQFQPISGTQLLSAVNTATPVIEVDPSTFFAVADGMWFTASNPTGPWAVATAVPPSIYTIPVSSPLHYVTYVKVYGSDDSTVTVGYTPGYMGTAVSSEGTVVYGTGYYQPGWIGDDTWYGYPWSYGWGAGLGWAPMTGFCWGFNAGRWWGATHPWWGPWRGLDGANLHNYSWNHFNGYNAWSGDRGLLQGAVRSTASLAPAARSAVMGDRGVGGRPWGDGAAGARAAAAGARPNNVYAGHDGNVYRNGANGWERYGQNGWSNAERGDGWNQQSQQLRAQEQARNEYANRGYGGWGGEQRSYGGGFSGGGFDRGGFSGGGFHGGGRR